MMWCRADDTSECINMIAPLAPGTECNLLSREVGVCYQGRCVQYGEVETPIEGGWGTWSDWTSCSFSCGTGVQSSSRKCNSPM